MGKIDMIEGGTVTTPEGFMAGAVTAGIKEGKTDKPDVGLLYSEAACVAAGVFTNNKIKAAPVVVSQKHLQSKNIFAIVANSGCANAFTHQQGLADALEMAALAAEGIGVNPQEVLVASTGVIGVPLPMKRIRATIGQMRIDRQGGHDFARAIMTTDTFAKEGAVSVPVGRDKYRIGGVAKGAGMIHPNMATLLCFLTTDAMVDAEFLRLALRRAMDISFNMLTIDGETSTNDSAFLLANGQSGLRTIQSGTGEGESFEQALTSLCVYLAKCIAYDGEGATKLLEVTVEGARSVEEARMAARTVAGAPLVKAAIHGGDPNFGRVLSALGRSGAEVVESKIGLSIGGTTLVRGGRLVYHQSDLAKVKDAFKKREVEIQVKLGIGQGKATAWGCDLSEEYVTINSAYMT